MNRQELSGHLLAGLIELEQSGDLVITHSIPSSLADRLCSKLIQGWAREFVDGPPSEIVIEDWSATCAKKLQEGFGLEELEAREVVERFYSDLAKDRSIGDLADLVAHQGAEETALGAYYSVCLRRGAYYSSGYLDWRTEFYAKARGAR